MGKILQKPSVPKRVVKEDQYSIDSNEKPKESCPICRTEFSQYISNNEIEAHVNYCIEQELRIKTTVDKPKKPKEVFMKYIKMTKDPKLKFGYTGDKMLSPYSGLPFQKKLQLFRNNIKSIKVDWREGCCNLKLTRDFFLEESISQFNEINIYKELKINFKGEVSHDAGGIIREWFTIIFKELQSYKRNIFQKSIDNNQISFIISNTINDTKFTREIFKFLGKIFAKAILENITINSCLNKIFFKIILNEKICLDDLVFIDKTLYNSLKELENCKEHLDDMELFFVVNYEKDGNIYTEELIDEGSFVQVNKSNLPIFIEKKIEFLIKKDLELYNDFRSSFLSIIIENYISLFNSDELELIINGQPFIDLEDWRNHTIYQGIYKENHLVINWFWEIIFKLEQEDLAKILQFCTGTSRVPLGGFSVLESNRGEISKFCIVSVEYNKQMKNNFIKAHTCFNRIDLPIYPNKSLLEEAVKFIIRNEILGFGID